jgi:hypothetical protein
MADKLRIKRIELRFIYFELVICVRGWNAPKSLYATPLLTSEFALEAVALAR